MYSQMIYNTRDQSDFVEISEEGYDQALLLSITQLAAPLKTMAIRHADIINNAWQPFVWNDQSKPSYYDMLQDMMIFDTGKC